MKKRKKIERWLIGLTLLISFILVIKYELVPLHLAIFAWIITSFYFLNFWKYEETEEGLYFLLPFLLLDILMIQFLLTCITWIFGVVIFAGFWAELFSWPTLIAIFATSFYMLFLLDKSIRQDLKKFFKLKNYKEEVLHEK